MRIITIFIVILLIPYIFQQSQNGTTEILSLYEVLAKYPKPTPECAEKAKNMFMLSDTSLFHTILYSGKSLNDLGSYEGCINKNNTRYILLQILGLPANIALGICGPKECNENDYEGIKRPISAILAGVFAVNNETIKTPLKQNITDKNILFADTQKRYNEYNFYNTGFYITMMFIGVILILNLCGSIISYFSKNTPKIAQYLKCFNFNENLSKIFSVSEPQDPDLSVFNGIRVFSMCWVILGHTFYYAKHGFLSNVMEMPIFGTTFKYSYILSAPFSVDIFFFLSGFLATYLLLKEFRIQNSADIEISCKKIYLSRFMRILPMYIFAILLYNFIMPLFGSGPGFYTILDDMNETCSKYWIYNILFMNNFLSSNKECMGYTWYLANDMQFFIITPILVLVYLKRRSFGYLLVTALGIICTIIGISICFKYKLSASYMKFSAEYFDQYYRLPYNRIAPYLIGILCSFAFSEYKNTQITLFSKFTELLKRSYLLRYFLYIVSITILFVLVHSIYYLNKYPENWEGWPDVLYLLFSKPLFVLALFFLIYPTMLGNYCRLLKSVFESKIFIPLARITFGAYLIHPMLMIFNNASSYKEIYFEHNSLFLQFIGYAFIAYLISAVFTALLESPVIQFSKLMIGSRTQKSQIKSPVKEMKKWQKTEQNDEDAEHLNINSTNNSV